MIEIVEKRKEESNSSITEENLQKAMEFVRQNPEKIKAISVTDLLKQQRDLYFKEGKKEDSFLFELLVLLGAEFDDDTFYYAIDLGMLGLVKLLVERYNFDVNGEYYIPNWISDVKLEGIGEVIIRIEAQNKEEFIKQRISMMNVKPADAQTEKKMVIETLDSALLELLDILKSMVEKEVK